MGDFTRYQEGLLIGFLWCGEAYTPAAWTVGAFTAPPTDTGGGTEVPTTGGTGYSRALLGSCTKAQDGNGLWWASNVAAVVFPEALAAWGTITHYGIFDAPTGGNLIAYKQLTAPPGYTTAAPVTIGVGDVLRFPAGQLQFGHD